MVSQVSEPLTKRTSRPVASLPTTAEKYGEQFDIPDDVQMALQNVGRRGRAAVTQGRPFDRSQTAPQLPPGFTSPSVIDDLDLATTSGLPTQPFITSNEAIADAHLTILESKRRELQPYSSTETISPALRQGSSPIPGQSLDGAFGSDGIDEDVVDRRAKTGKKRRGDEVDDEDDGDDGDATEIDEDEEEEEEPPLFPPTASTSSRIMPLPIASMSSLDDFPSVFNSSRISHPELAGRPDLPSAPRHESSGKPGRRLFKPMPRQMGKTMSAPVGALGGWGSGSGGMRSGAGAGGSGMDIDAEMEDGFDVGDWAESEEF